MKKVAWKLVPAPFSISKNPLEKGFQGGQHVDLDEFR